MFVYMAWCVGYKIIKLQKNWTIKRTVIYDESFMLHTDFKSISSIAVKEDKKL